MGTRPHVGCFEVEDDGVEVEMLADKINANLGREDKCGNYVTARNIISIVPGKPGTLRIFYRKEKMGRSRPPTSRESADSM